MWAEREKGGEGQSKEKKKVKLGKVNEEEESSPKNTVGLGEKEMNKAVRKMKERNAAGIDEIPMEAWRYGEKWVNQGLTDVIKQIWNKWYPKR